LDITTVAVVDRDATADGKTASELRGQGGYRRILPRI